MRVISANLSAGRGDLLGLAEDFAGAPLPKVGSVDVGAYQATD